MSPYCLSTVLYRAVSTPSSQRHPKSLRRRRMSSRPAPVIHPLPSAIVGTIRRSWVARRRGRQTDSTVPHGAVYTDRQTFRHSGALPSCSSHPHTTPPPSPVRNPRSAAASKNSDRRRPRNAASRCALPRRLCGQCLLARSLASSSRARARAADRP